MGIWYLDVVIRVIKLPRVIRFVDQGKLRKSLRVVALTEPYENEKSLLTVFLFKI